MARSLTRRRHGRHSNYDRLARRTENFVQAKQDAKQFVDDQDSRLGDTAEGPEGVFDSMHLVQGEESAFSFEDVQDASDPSDIGLNPDFPTQTMSIDFDGVTESLGKLTDVVMGIANAWTIGWWGKPDIVTEQHGLISLRPTSGLANRIQILRNATDLRIIWADSSGTPDNDATWNGAFSAGAWHYVHVYWNGTILQPFVDSVSLGAPDTGINNPAITMTDTARRLNVGDLVGGSGFEWDGPISQAFMHRVAKTTQAEVDALYNGGNPNALDLNGSFTDYSDAGDLAHWWRCGHEASPNIGKDFAEAGFTPTIDIEVPDSVDITDADRVADVPT